MPARRNNNPDLKKSVQDLARRANNGATTPHGTKTVEPDEGLNMISIEGDQIPWNYETARAWRSAIDSGADQIARAQLQLETAQLEIDQAKDRIGRVAAGEIERIDGRIIVNGTVDLPALNVTDTMSAAIVNAMSTNTKKLVVTEDAILNRATVIQGLVTTDLIAQRVDSRYISAQDLSTANLEVRGRFRTAPMGLPQILIQPSQTSWNNQDLAVWFTPDGTAPGGGSPNAKAITGGMWMNPTANTGDNWAPQKLNLRGQSRAGVRIYESLTITSNVPGIGGTITTNQGEALSLNSDGIAINAMVSSVSVSGPEVKFNSYSDFWGESGPSSEIRLLSGSGGVRFTSKNGNTWQYNVTASSAANLYMDKNGKIHKSTSSRRYKKYISDAEFDATKLRDVRLRKWRDRKLQDTPEDMRYYYGAIAEEVDPIFPEFVSRITDPAYVNPETGEAAPGAPSIPDGLEYGTFALQAAVGGFQYNDKRIAELETRDTLKDQKISDLENRLAVLEAR